MGKKRNVIGNLCFKKMSGTSSGMFYVVDIDHVGDISKAHPVSIESLKSIYPNIGEAIDFISPVVGKKATPYPPIGKKRNLKGIKGAKRRAFLGSADEMFDKVTQITGKAISSSLKKRVVNSVYPPIGIVLVKDGEIIKVIKNNGRK